VLLYAGIALLGVGLLFKIGAVPFQSWKPDVYQGAPTPITALMASLLGGAIIAITQTDVKRLLAYSSIAQAGYILTGVVAATVAGLSSSLFYLAAYGFATIGAFGVVTLIREPGGEAGHLSSWAGLGKRSPLVAGVFALFLITFAGIPLTSGFIGKFAVFQAAIGGGAVPLVVVGALSSAILAFPYVRVIVLMFFSDPATDGPVVVRPSAFTASAVAIGVIATLVLGIVPEPLLRLAHDAASQLFVR
jgi:NADH:ubiquinone oxidoreductase subunit 2 (subunit N)